MPSTHRHPNPWLDRLTQYTALTLLILILISLPLQGVLVLAGAPVFGLVALFTLALAPFVLLLTITTPAVTVAPDGLTVQPRIWKTQVVPWAAVRAIKPYPLLPPADAETSRRYLAGRTKYQPAEGLMLIIPTLPLQYRITGLLAGEGWTPVIAVTNRTHTQYPVLVKKLRAFHEAATEDAG
jgi:hypothetical protein